MKKIGLLADTHNYLDPAILGYFEGCDEIWHAGDFGTLAIANQLREVAPVTGVYGNIDGNDVRGVYPLLVRRDVEGLDFMMTHIGGHPGRYALPVLPHFKEKTPDVFICGHSHIPVKLWRDKQRTHAVIESGCMQASRWLFKYTWTIVRVHVNRGR